VSASRPGPLVFLKLGGSLLGDKRRPGSFRPGVIQRVGGEILSAVRRGRLRLLLAHGGGGAAHYPAGKFRTRQGLPGGGGWRGFAETRRGVLETNRRVLDALGRAGLFPALVPPSAGVLACDGAVAKWDLATIRRLLDAGRIPLIHGDAALDCRIGFTILSTEELFEFLAKKLRPGRIILACDVKGVYAETLGRPRPMTRVDSANYRRVMSFLRSPSPRLRGGRAWDVTGGMAAKVERLYRLARRQPGLEARIVSGLSRGAVESALLGGEVGTRIA